MSNEVSRKKRSQYYSSLDNSGKRRYEQKLYELQTLNDPLALDEKQFDLTANVTSQPEISFADILC